MQRCSYELHLLYYINLKQNQTFLLHDQRTSYSLNYFPEMSSGIITYWQSARIMLCFTGIVKNTGKHCSSYRRVGANIKHLIASLFNAFITAVLKNMSTSPCLKTICPRKQMLLFKTSFTRGSD